MQPCTLVEQCCSPFGDYYLKCLVARDEFLVASVARSPCIERTTAVALAFEEMRTPYASGREICVQKFGNAYQRNERDSAKWMARFKSTFATITQVSDILECCSQTRFPFTILACLPWSFASCSLRPVETEFRFLRTLYAWLPWFCVQLDFYAYHTQKFALTRPLEPHGRTWPTVCVYWYKCPRYPARISPAGVVRYRVTSGLLPCSSGRFRVVEDNCKGSIQEKNMSAKRCGKWLGPGLEGTWLDMPRMDKFPRNCSTTPPAHVQVGSGSRSRPHLHFQLPLLLSLVYGI